MNPTRINTRSSNRADCAEAGGRQGAGLYIHVPFCRRKCPYCDFYSVIDLSLRPGYVSAIRQEMALRRDEAAVLVFDTVYFGGGTPSLLSPRQVGLVLDTARKTFSIAPEPEITLEANPGTVDFERLNGYRRAGVNRLNLGLQSLDEGRLAFLGRIHTARQGLAAVDLARKAGIDNIGLDLIYGTPGQGTGPWEDELSRALALSPRHLSCYMLSLAPGTPLDRQRRNGRFVALSDDNQARLFETTHRVLIAAGFDHYEVSNFARFRNWRSRHNTKYWNRLPYIGLGPAAHSFIEPRRWWNHRDIGRWGQDLAKGRQPVAGNETLSRGQQISETIALGLRTADGIDLDDFARRFGVRLEQAALAAIAALKRHRWIHIHRGRLGPSPKGLLVADALGRQIVEQIRMKAEG